MARGKKGYWVEIEVTEGPRKGNRDRFWVDEVAGRSMKEGDNIIVPQDIDERRDPGRGWFRKKR